MRPQSHVTGDVGQKAVALLFTNWEWTADLIRSDYGEDLNCHVFIDNQRTPLHFRCQVKSSDDADSKIRRLRSGDFGIQVASSTCHDWLLSYYPVLLIVYDRKSGVAYWADATAQVRAKVASLSRKEVMLRVSRDHVLENDKSKIISTLAAFYARLLKVRSEAIERTVFPVLMPRYRAVPSMNSRALLKAGMVDKDRHAYVSVHRDTLPAWTTSLRILDGQFLSGMSFRASSLDLGEFSELLTAYLSTVPLPVEEGEWLGFVCGPIRFSIQRDEDAEDSLGRDLTGWSSYAKIGDRVVYDREYAFEPPNGFIRQIGRRARSWPGYFFVSSEHDVALQLLAEVATTPADRLFRSMLREHMLGQFLPWECPAIELEVLKRQLWDAELVFASLEESELGTKAGKFVVGAISTPMFAPSIGLIPQALSWAELEQGTVRSRLERTGLLVSLPGREGSSELRDRLLSFLSHLTEEVPEGWLVDGTSPVPGLPVDLSARRVVVQRFRSDSAFDHEQATQALQALKVDLIGHVQDTDSIEVAGSIISSFEKIAELEISWSPGLSESSATAVEKALPKIVEVFDEVLPRTMRREGNLETSLGVLRFAGELYFEGDRLY